MAMVAYQILAGCVIADENQAILYAHRENEGSSIPSLQDQYKSLFKILVAKEDNSQKLTLGSLSTNALFVFSIRRDKQI
ncbi:hypothetical protein MBANPS3_011336 [Mucor bainieri]